MFRIWSRNISSAVFLEHSQGKLAVTASRAAISAANKVSPTAKVVGVLAVEDVDSPVVGEAKKLPGLSKIILSTHKGYSRLLPEVVTPLLLALQSRNEYTHWWTSHSSIGKSIFPRFTGALLGKGIKRVAPISDIISVKDEKTFIRPIYAGNAQSELQTDASINIITVRPTAFPETSPMDNNVDIENFVIEPTVECLELTKWIGEELTKSNRPELASAEIVVSGGRALKGAENFKLLYDLADAFGGAAVGASRAAVDAGYVPNDLQIGQTGKVVAPKLYIAVGISGAIQHVAGMKDSRTIVAINKDPDAPIFQVADYGLVGDLFTIIPELIQKLQKQQQ